MGTFGDGFCPIAGLEEPFLEEIHELGFRRRLWSGQTTRGGPCRWWELYARRQGGMRGHGMTSLRYWAQLDEGGRQEQIVPGPRGVV